VETLLKNGAKSNYRTSLIDWVCSHNHNNNYMYCNERAKIVTIHKYNYYYNNNYYTKSAYNIIIL